VEGPPIPANWHADIAEFGAVLRAVDLSKKRFTIVELGCGWGCWLNIAGTAARHAGREVHLVGVEGDEGHICFARESTATNGFTPGQVTLHHGIAAATNGTALFPRQSHAGGDWGLEPIFGATEAEQEATIGAGSHDVLPMIALADVVPGEAKIDLLHIDIQGGEANFIAGCLTELNRRVAYIVVGRHSRSIEGRLFEVMQGAGWILEMERPAILALTPAPEVVVDGVQGWRNPALFPQ
jgi:FkbM family methyltransferase